MAHMDRKQTVRLGKWGEFVGLFQKAPLHWHSMALWHLWGLARFYRLGFADQGLGIRVWKLLNQEPSPYARPSP